MTAELASLINMSMSGTPQRSIVFISYSHDSEEHKLRVVGLAASLARDGCDCRVDVHKNTDEDWPTWMVEQLRHADFVVCACTNTYHERFRGGAPPNVGLGVGWEAGLIRRLLYQRKLRNDRIVPVVYSAREVDFIPLELAGYDYFILDSETGYEALLRRILRRAEFSRPVEGPAPELDSREIPPAFARPTGGISGSSSVAQGARRAPKENALNISGSVVGQNVVIGGSQVVAGSLAMTSGRQTADEKTRMDIVKQLSDLEAEVARIPRTQSAGWNDMRLALADLVEEATRTPTRAEWLETRLQRFLQTAADPGMASVGQIAARAAALVRSLES